MKKNIVKNLFFPPKCMACRQLLPYDGGRCEHVMCLECRAKFEKAKIAVCKNCGLPVLDCRCMTDKLRESGACGLVKLAEYSPSDINGVMNKIVNNCKRTKIKNNFEFTARQLMPGIERILDDMRICGANVIITYCPRSDRAKRKYGFDQAELLAHEISVIGNFEFIPLLSRRKFTVTKAQKNLGFEARAVNAGKSYFIDSCADIKNKTVILVDDVVTTGATMASCTSLIKGMGADNVIGVCIAADAGDK